MKKFIKNILNFIKKNWFKILIVIFLLQCLSTLDKISKNAEYAADACNDAEYYCDNAQDSCENTEYYCSDSGRVCEDAKDACESVEYYYW